LQLAEEREEERGGERGIAGDPDLDLDPENWGRRKFTKKKNWPSPGDRVLIEKGSIVHLS
jgi:hypothetical protein